MYINKITFKSQRDFYADFVCEHCGHLENRPGYDDNNFHNIVIPNMTCENCGKKALDTKE